MSWSVGRCASKTACIAKCTNQYLSCDGIFVPLSSYN